MPRRRTRQQQSLPSSPKGRQKEAEVAEDAEEEEPEEEQLFCHCQQPIREDDDRKFVACEICDQWYHVECVGLSGDTATEPTKFMCRNCAKEGFLGSAGDGWFIEPQPSAAAPPPRGASPAPHDARWICARGGARWPAAGPTRRRPRGGRRRGRRRARARRR